MNVLVVAATKEEIMPSIPLLEEKGIAYLITGVGMVATAYHLGKKLAANSYDLVLNVGIAGCFSKDIALGAVVEINRDLFTELGAEDGDSFLTIDSMGLGSALYSSKPRPDLHLMLPQVTGITVNTVHGNDKSIATIVHRFPGILTESMEGAAFLYACLQENVCSYQVRAISNYVEKRNRSTWNIPLAIQNLNQWLSNLIRNQLV